MTQSVPPKMEGLEGPNPLELFYEKNKKWVVTLAVLVVVSLAVYYGIEKLRRAEINKEWTEFNVATGLAKRYSTPVELMKLPPSFEYRHIYWGNQIFSRRAELVTGLLDDIKDADGARIDAQIQASKGKPKEPWLIWVAANKAYGQREWDTAKRHCEDLQARFSGHILCGRGDYPPQVRKKKDKEDENAAKKKDKEDLEPPIAGSMVENLLAAIARDEEFEKARAGFFKAPEPDEEKTAIIKLADVGEIEIGFYSKAAPKHVEAFRKNFAEGFYTKMRVHKIKRDRKDTPDPRQPRTIHLGHPNSKDANRATWTEEVEAKDEDILEFEESSERVSMFPFIVAAELEKDGKSSARRFFICVNDCAAAYDGEYVVFGRVIRGMEELEDIANGTFLDEAEENAGEGRPSRDILVESTSIK